MPCSMSGGGRVCKDHRKASMGKRHFSPRYNAEKSMFFGSALGVIGALSVSTDTNAKFRVGFAKRLFFLLRFAYRSLIAARVCMKKAVFLKQSCRLALSLAVTETSVAFSWEELMRYMSILSMIRYFLNRPSRHKPCTITVLTLTTLQAMELFEYIESDEFVFPV